MFDIWEATSQSILRISEGLKVKLALWILKSFVMAFSYSMFNANLILIITLVSCSKRLTSFSSFTALVNIFSLSFRGLICSMNIVFLPLRKVEVHFLKANQFSLYGFNSYLWSLFWRPYLFYKHSFLIFKVNEDIFHRGRLVIFSWLQSISLPSL